MFFLHTDILLCSSLFGNQELQNGEQPPMPKAPSEPERQAGPKCTGTPPPSSPTQDCRARSGTRTCNTDEVPPPLDDSATLANAKVQLSLNAAGGDKDDGALASVLA